MGNALVDDRSYGSLVVDDAHDAVLGPRAASHGTPPSPHESGSRARVIDAALRCVGRFGLSKTTVDDIAREAGLSRATLYRSFPGGRDEVFSATLHREIARYFSTLADELAGIDDLEELLVRTLACSADQIARHDALQWLLNHEPEVVLPSVAFAGLDRLLALAADFLSPYLRPSLGATEARRVAEWIGRLVVSHVACPTGSVPSPWFPGLNPVRSPALSPFALHPEPIGEAEARRIVRKFVMPGIDVLRAGNPSVRTDQSRNVSPHDQLG